MEDEVATLQTTGQLLASTREVKRKMQNLVLLRDESILCEALPTRCKEIVIFVHDTAAGRQICSSGGASWRKASERLCYDVKTCCGLAELQGGVHPAVESTWHADRGEVCRCCLPHGHAGYDHLEVPKNGLQWIRLDGSMTAAARDIAVQDFRQHEWSGTLKMKRLIIDPPTHQKGGDLKRRF